MSDGVTKTWWTQRTLMEQVLLIACGLVSVVAVGLCIGVDHLRRNEFTTVTIAGTPAPNVSLEIVAPDNLTLEFVQGNDHNDTLFILPPGFNNISMLGGTPPPCVSKVNKGGGCDSPLTCACGDFLVCCAADGSSFSSLKCLKPNFGLCDNGADCCSNVCLNGTFCCANMGQPAPGPEYCCPGHIWEENICFSTVGEFCHTDTQCWGSLVCHGSINELGICQE